MLRAPIEWASLGPKDYSLSITAKRIVCKVNGKHMLKNTFVGRFDDTLYHDWQRNIVAAAYWARNGTTPQLHVCAAMKNGAIVPLAYQVW